MSRIEDIKRINEIAKRLGHKLTMTETKEMWSEYSADMGAAFWQPLPETDEALGAIVGRLVFNMR